MKKFQILLFTLLLSIFSSSSEAGPFIPQFVNLQAVLLDDGGNVLKDLDETDIHFKIIDGAENVYYEEVQHVIVVHGAISVSVGQGNAPGTSIPTGGIPLEALAPDTTKILRFKLLNANVRDDQLEMVSVPYAYYAQVAIKLDHDITTLDVADGGLEFADLSAEAVEALNESLRAEGFGAQEIAIAARLNNSPGNTVEAVLTNFDSLFTAQAAQIQTLQNRATALEGTAAQADARYLNATGDAMTGNLNMQGAEIQNVGNDRWSVGAKIREHENRIGQLEIQGDLSPGVLSAAQVANGSWNVGCGGVMAVTLDQANVPLNVIGSIPAAHYFAVVSSTKNNANVGSRIQVEWAQRVSYDAANTMYRQQIVFKEVHSTAQNCNNHTINYTIYRMAIGN